MRFGLKMGYQKKKYNEDVEFGVYKPGGALPQIPDGGRVQFLDVAASYKGGGSDHRALTTSASQGSPRQNKKGREEFVHVCYNIFQLNVW
jgi:hypothetical protein